MPQARIPHSTKSVLSLRIIGNSGFNSTAGEEPLPPSSLGVAICFPVIPVSEKNDLGENLPVTTGIVGPHDR
jgi:hypothetical protein